MSFPVLIKARKNREIEHFYFVSLPPNPVTYLVASLEEAVGVFTRKIKIYLYQASQSNYPTWSLIVQLLLTDMFAEELN